MDDFGGATLTTEGDLTAAKKKGVSKQQLGAMLGGLSAAQRDELRQKILEGHGYPPDL